jgi:hypothetical protein
LEDKIVIILGSSIKMSEDLKNEADLNILGNNYKLMYQQKINNGINNIIILIK